MIDLLVQVLKSSTFCCPAQLCGSFRKTLPSGGTLSSSSHGSGGITMGTSPPGPLPSDCSPGAGGVAIPVLGSSLVDLQQHCGALSLLPDFFNLLFMLSHIFSPPLHLRPCT